MMHTCEYDWDKSGRLIKNRGLFFHLSLWRGILLYLNLSLSGRKKQFELSVFGQGVWISTEHFGVWNQCPPAETMLRVIHTRRFCLRLRYHSLSEILETLREER